MMHRSSSTAAGSKKKKMPIIVGVNNGWKALVSVPVVMAFFVVFCALMAVGVDAAGAAGPPKTGPQPAQQPAQQPKNGPKPGVGGSAQPVGDGKGSSEEESGVGGGKGGPRQGNQPPAPAPQADEPSSTDGGVPPVTGPSSGEEGGPSSDGTPGSGGGPPVTPATGNKTVDAGKKRHEVFKKAMEDKNEQKAFYQCEPEVGQSNEFCGCIVKDKDGKFTTRPQSFQFPPTDLGCNADFYKIAMMPMCGNEWFDQMKLCALANFYEDKEPSKSGVVDDPNQKMLIMLDGCFTSKAGGCQVKSMKVTHTEPGGGGIFSSCSNVDKWCGGGGETEDDKCYEGGYERKDVNIDVEKAEEKAGGGGGGAAENSTAASGVPINVDTASFTLPVMLRHRVCNKVFGDDWVPEGSKYTGLILHVTHNCGGDKTTEIALPDVTMGEFPNRYAELRGLHVDLDEGKAEQYVRDQNNAAKFDVNEGGLKWDTEQGVVNLNGWKKDKAAPEEGGDKGGDGGKPDVTEAPK